MRRPRFATVGHPQETAAEQRALVLLLAGLPRLAPGGGWFALLIDLAGLLVAGATGTALLHLAAYHLRAGSTAGTMLAHCPLRPALLLILGFAVLTGVLAHAELRRLRAERARLDTHLGAMSVPAAHTGARGPARLIGFIICLYLLELAGVALFAQIMPAQALMHMDGLTMTMPVLAAFPLPLGQLLIATLLALALWRCERRVLVLSRAISWLRRLIAVLVSPVRPLVYPRGQDDRTPCLFHGVHAFSRPPPVFVP